MNHTIPSPAGPIPLLYEDNHLLVVSKPAGLLSQEDHTGNPDLLTLCKAFIKERDQKPGNVFLGLVHRLDRPVSGVMVLAKTSKAASRISEQIRKRTVGKRYLAVVEGASPPSGYLDHHLLKDSSTNRSRVIASPRRGSKPAQLSFTTLQQSGEHSLLEVQLLTGRAHQIRVQLAHIGHPIAGDQKYGSGRFPTIALHARSFTLMHPTTKEEMVFVAPMPENKPWVWFREEHRAE